MKKKFPKFHKNLSGAMTKGSSNVMKKTLGSLAASGVFLAGADGIYAELPNCTNINITSVDSDVIGHFSGTMAGTASAQCASGLSATNTISCTVEVDPTSEITNGHVSYTPEYTLIRSGNCETTNSHTSSVNGSNGDGGGGGGGHNSNTDTTYGQTSGQGQGVDTHSSTVTSTPGGF